MSSGFRNRKAFVDHIAHRTRDALALHELAVRQLRDRGQRVVGAIEHELRP